MKKAAVMNSGFFMGGREAVSTGREGGARGPAYSGIPRPGSKTFPFFQHFTLK
jgi:hypothetical protein